MALLAITLYYQCCIVTTLNMKVHVKGKVHMQFACVLTCVGDMSDQAIKFYQKYSWSGQTRDVPNYNFQGFFFSADCILLGPCIVLVSATYV